MGECGCGATQIDEAYRIGRTKTVLAIQVYPGCSDCDYGPGVALMLFDSPKNEWLEGVDVGHVVPDEYGANRGRGIGVPIFDNEDLITAAKELEEHDPVEGYGSIAEWLEEHGAELAQGAVHKCWDRRQAAEMKRRAAKRKPKDGGKP